MSPQVRLLSRPLILILALLAFTETVVPQNKTRPFLKPDALQLSANPVPYEYDQWNFPVGELRFEIKMGGKGRRLNGQSGPTRFLVKIEREEQIKRLYYSEYKGDLLLLCEVEAGGYWTGFIVRLDGKTLRQKWRVHIPAFNVAVGLIEGNSVYLGAMGFAAKLNLDSGRYAWKHDDLYRKYHKEGAFNIFELPQIVGSEVIYTENQEAYSRKPNTIRFSKTNGRVLKVDLN